MISEAVRVLRYPEFQAFYGLTESDLLEYTQFLQSVSDVVILDPQYRAPFLRDPNDADVVQTAERGEADICAPTTRTFTRMLRCCHSVPRAASRYARRKSL